MKCIFYCKISHEPKCRGLETIHLLSVTKQDVKKGNNFCGVRENVEVFNYVNKRLSLSLILHIKNNVILLMLKVRYNNKS